MNTINRTVDEGTFVPGILEERKQNVTSLDIYSRLLNDRIVFIGQTINDELANSIQAQLIYLDSVSDDPIDIYINSPGGFVTAGLGIYDTIKLIKSPVRTICTGMCASMAAILLSSGDKRAALPHSKILIHQPSGGAYGQASDIEIAAKDINKTKKILEEILSENTGQTITKIHKDMDRDFWMSPEEALKYGIIDEIISNNTKTIK